MQIDLLIFDAAPQPLHEDVVTPRALAVHADLDVRVLQHLDEVDRGELRPLEALLSVKQRSEPD